MGEDNQPKHRQLGRELRRLEHSRAPADRLLIVCEGTKTEPQYIEEIRQHFRLSTANVQALPSKFGTEPIQVVDYAEHIFRNGDRNLGIKKGSFDKIYAVFDRDQHTTYHQALAKATSLDKRMKNDDGVKVPFTAIASVPCFELWLLYHFEEIHTPIHRTEVYERLKIYLPDYAKGFEGHWEQTRHNMGIAAAVAEARALETTAHDGNEPYTDMHILMRALNDLRQ